MYVWEIFWNVYLGVVHVRILENHECLCAILCKNNT